MIKKPIIFKQYLFRLTLLMLTLLLKSLETQSQVLKAEWIALTATHKAALFRPMVQKEKNSAAEEKKPLRAVIFLHDEWGVDSLAQKWCAELASAGFLVLAPDLLGRVPEEAMEAHEMERAQPEGAFVTLLGIARDTLLSRAHGNPINIGVYGIGMGGTATVETLLSDTLQPTKFKAGAVTVAALPHTPKEDLFLKTFPIYLVPLLGNFGERDLGTPPEAVKNFKQRLIACGRGKFIDFDFRIHFGARRGFMRSSNGVEMKASISSRARVITFFKKELK